MANANLFDEIQEQLPDEIMETLLSRKNLRIERIVSTGHSSPESFWYDQKEHEWAMVIRGEAKLLFEGDEESRTMRPGDFVHIPARRKHRVEWTSPDEPTIWLAIFYQECDA